MDIEFNATVANMVRFSGYTLLERSESPNFHLKTAELSSEDGSESIRLDYTWENDLMSESGSVYLDPGRGWAIRRSDVLRRSKPAEASSEAQPAPASAGPPVRLLTEVDYQDLPGGIPFPLRTTVSVQLADPKKMQQERFEVVRVTLGEPPTERHLVTGALPADL